jgi:5'-methylthioadenosine phosphorylase
VTGVEPPSAEIGIFGGSGFYSLLERSTEREVDTPYGPPSAPVAVGELGGRQVAFLPRHGPDHRYPPHRIPYRANVWAMRTLGVRWLLGPCAAGSLRADLAPGAFVVCDQLVDRTGGREQSFYDGPDTHHVSFADPYDPTLRRLLVECARAQGLAVHDGGTMVVVQGPRFSTRAESAWFRGMGWDVVNMTGHPEAVLARELEIAYAAVAVITDYDAGTDDPAVTPVTQAEVGDRFRRSLAGLRILLGAVVPRIPTGPAPSVAGVLAAARFGPAEPPR